MAETSKTVNNALTVLEAIAQHGPVSVAQLVRLLGLKRTVVYRSVETLRSRGYLRQNTEGYQLGAQLISLAQQTEAVLVNVADPILKALADEFGETFILAIRDGYEAVQVAQAVNEDMMVRIEMRSGFRHPLYRGASGLAILAFLDTIEIETVLQEADDVEKIKSQLIKVRETGHARSRGELSEGIQGVSVPVRTNEEVIGSIGIIVNSALTAKMLSTIPAISTAAEKISRLVSRT